MKAKDNHRARNSLLSIGRVPDLEGIGDVEFGLDRGRIKINEYMETSVPGIYAGINTVLRCWPTLPSVWVKLPLKNANKSYCYQVNFETTYLPEVMTVGLTEEQT